MASDRSHFLSTLGPPKWPAVGTGTSAVLQQGLRVLMGGAAVGQLTSFPMLGVPPGIRARVPAATVPSGRDGSHERAARDLSAAIAQPGVVRVEAVSVRCTPRDRLQVFVRPDLTIWKPIPLNFQGYKVEIVVLSSTHAPTNAPVVGQAAPSPSTPYIPVASSAGPLAPPATDTGFFVAVLAIGFGLAMVLTSKGT